ncbi:MAG: UDP-3-O-(3-hydroxymyristoyl)glucosamine N-acyltransferase [Bacteroidota bacterium]|nr:UDP-3-O-(3-hydroxymyristoyl)glucosamine N-acyltransferase [Bacteroidota bacterium]
MKIKVRELAEWINGTIEGNPDVEISSFGTIQEAGEGSLTFLSNSKYEEFIYSTHASAILVSLDFIPSSNISTTLVRVADVYTTLGKLLEAFNAIQDAPSGVEQPNYVSTGVEIINLKYLGAFAYIGKNAKLGKKTSIYPQVYIGDNVTIGENTVIYAGVKVYANTQIGDNCIIHSGAVLGSDGFGFAPQPDGSYIKIPQTGKVVLGNNVEIGANTTIDRATINETVIGDGAKLDNLIQIAHNVKIGNNTALAAQVGVAGSTVIGKNVVVGGQVGISGHITIADAVQIGAQSGIAHSITEAKSQWFGSPAITKIDALKSIILFKKLPEIYKRLQTLEGKQL